MRKLLDKMFANQKAAIVAPLITAGVMYLLYVLFGQGNDKVNWLIMTPIISLIAYVSVYFVLWLQIKNPSCPQGFLNFLEWMVLLVFGLGAVVFGVQFLMNLESGFTPALCVEIVSWSAIALVHGKRSV